MPKDDGLEALLESNEDLVETETFYNGEVALYFSPKLHAYYVLDEDDRKLLVPGVTTILAQIDKSPQLMQWASNSAVQLIRQRLQERYADGDLYTIAAEELEPLLNDARFNFRKISKTATDIGHLAHEWLERYLKLLISHKLSGVSYTDGVLLSSLVAFGGEFPPFPEDEKAQNCVKAALGWFEKHKFRPVSSERKIYSREYNYAGTKDWDGYITSCGDPACCSFDGEKFFLGDFKSSKAIYDEYRLQLAAYKQASEEEFPEHPYDGCIIMRLDKEGNGIETKTIMPDEFDADFDGFLGTLQMYTWAKQLDLDKKFEKAVAKAAKPKKVRKAPRKAVIKEYEPIPVAA